MKIRIITDSASDFGHNEREDVTVLPLTVTFGGTEYRDGETISKEEFYEKLVESDELPVTSQVPPYAFEEAYRSAQEAGEAVIVITLSSRLSGTFQSANIAAEDFTENLYLVDSENVAVGERALVELALRLIGQGMEAKEIAETLEKEKKNIRLLALLDTLEYLQKGGRISKAAAFAGGLLSIKPVIAIEEGAVSILGKARGSRQGNNLLAQQIAAAGGVDFTMPYALAYTGLSDALLQKYIRDSEAFWKDGTKKLPIHLIGATIGTHAGPGAIAVAFFAKNKAE